MLKVIFISVLLSVQVNGAWATYEVPVDLTDFRPFQGMTDHSEYRVKKIYCDGEVFGLMYDIYWGWSEGSSLVNVCKWKMRKDFRACRNDSSAESVRCYNEIVDELGLPQKRKKT